jgi:cold shock CspA family protein
MGVAASSREVIMDGSHTFPAQNPGDAGTVNRKPSAVRAGATTKGRARGVKPDERGRPMTGRVHRILHGQGHGFIRARDSRLLFFHRHDVATGLFNRLVARDRVAFEVIENALVGPRAVKIHRAESKHAAVKARRATDRRSERS